MHGTVLFIYIYLHAGKHDSARYETPKILMARYDYM